MQTRVLNPDAVIFVPSSKQQGDIKSLIVSRIPKIVIVDPLFLTANATTQSLINADDDLCFQMEGHAYRFTKADPDLFDYSSIHQRELRLQQELIPKQNRFILSESSLRPYRFKHTHKKTDLRSFINRLLYKIKELKSNVNDRLRNLQIYDYLVLLLIFLLVLGTITLSFVKINLQTGVFVTVALLKGEFVDPVNVLIEKNINQSCNFPYLYYSYHLPMPL